MFTAAKIWLLAPFALCLALPASSKPAPPSPPARREIQAIYNKINASVMQKNVDGAYDYDSDDYTVIDNKGHVHESSEGRQEMEVADSIKATSIIQGFAGTEMEATVTVKDHMVVLVANNANGRAVRISADDTAREHWIKTADGWRRTRTRILSGRSAFRRTSNRRRTQERGERGKKRRTGEEEANGGRRGGQKQKGRTQGSPLLVVRPKPEHFDHTRGFVYLVHKAVLDVDAA